MTIRRGFFVDFHELAKSVRKCSKFRIVADLGQFRIVSQQVEAIETGLYRNFHGFDRRGFFPAKASAWAKPADIAATCVSSRP